MNAEMRPPHDFVDRQVVVDLHAELDAVNRNLPEDPLRFDGSKGSRFALDQRDNKLTVFKGEHVVIESGSTPRFGNDLLGQAEESEEWITVSVSPINMYTQASLGRGKPDQYSGFITPWLMVRHLSMSLSSTGRSVQQEYWVSTPMRRREEDGEYIHDNILKEEPDIESLNLRDDDLPSTEPLRGANLERLKHIISQAEMGNIADTTEIFDWGEDWYK